MILWLKSLHFVKYNELEDFPVLSLEFSKNLEQLIMESFSAISPNFRENSKDTAGNNFHSLYLTKLQSKCKLSNHKIIVLAVC